MRIRAGVLPSRNFVLVVLSLAIVASMIFAASRTSQISSDLPEIRITKTSQPNTPSYIAVADSDGDGVFDWEEELWGTDPLLSDSDGDGVLDNIEIESLREQIDIGFKQNVPATRSELPPKELSETDIFARSIFSKYSNLKSIYGGALNSTQIEALAQTFAADLDLYAPNLTQFTSSALTISNDNSDTGLQAYAGELNDVFGRNNTGLESEIVIIARIGEDSDSSTRDIADLKVIAASYDNAARELIGITVPSSLASMHLGVSNSLLAISKELQIIAAYEDDPIFALAAIERYRIDSQGLDVTLIELGEALAL